MLRPRDWLHWSSLFAPLCAYNLGLKLLRVGMLGEPVGTLSTACLLLSDVTFNLGFALSWLGLLALGRRARRFGAIIVGLMHLAALTYAMVSTGAHRYFRTTGTVLDAGLVIFAAERYDDVKPVMASETPWLTFGLVIAYACFGPFLVVRLASGMGSWSGRRTWPTGSFVGGAAAAGVAMCAVAAIATTSEFSRSFATDPLLHLAVSARRHLLPLPPIAAAPSAPALGGRLQLRDSRRPRNVVVIVLESTGASVATPYGGRFAATPFLAELAEESLMVQRAYTTIPHTSKALVSILCGLEPRPTRRLLEAEPGRIPAVCLPELFEREGYRTAFFETATEAFENRRDLVRNFGFQDFYPGESLETEGFEAANYFGVEDAAILAPSRRWLEDVGERAFLATYLTNTAHHDYLAPRRYGIVDFVQDDEQNRYLNAVRYQDFFVRDLYRQYQELGLLASTVFVIVGDHGEAFGEHVRRKHDDVPYEEVVRVPFLLVGEEFRAAPKVNGPVSLIDILPTAVDAAGFDMVGDSYPGQSILRPLEERTLWLSCYNDLRCLGSVRGFEKYVHYFEDQPDELFDLSVDPLEESNLANERRDAARKNRQAVLEWRSGMLALYEEHEKAGKSSGELRR